MIEHPILFSGPMVRAILEGRKTQTRRAMNPQPELSGIEWMWRQYRWLSDKRRPIDVLTGGSLQPCPFGAPGDRLWVRETWAQPAALDPDPTVYRADYPACVPKEFENVPDAVAITWKPSIHMPRAMSRITLEITGVRIERLQTISESDARAEGVTIEDHHMRGYCAGAYWPPSIRAIHDLWDSLNAARGHGWDVNPWVWVVEFKRIET